MSARKAVNTNGFKHLTLVARESRLALSMNDVVFHKGGIEFRADKAFSPWTEITLSMSSPLGHGKLHCNGVVISCTGNRHQGYHVSVIFTSLSKQGEALMNEMVALT
jgi:hypothetical protein